MPKTKQDVMDSISELLGIDRYKVSTGSTEPSIFFRRIVEELAIGDASNLTKPEVARLIVESSGEIWSENFESNGGTVTLEGLLAVEKAVLFFLD